MNLSLEGKTALVCGSTQGIGWASAQELASLGARVILLARNESKLKEKVGELGQGHGYLTADFSNPDQLKSVIEGWTKDNTAHILINNTGGPPAGQAIAAQTDAYLSAFNQHLICNQILASHVVHGMKSASYGRIINVISTSVKQPLANLGVSNTIRGAVANWSKTLANELGGFGITVNNVLPGATATGRLDSIIDNKSNKSGKAKDDVAQAMKAAIPAGRFGLPSEIGQAVAFLASPAAGYINGVNLPVDGGRTSCL